MQCSLAWNGRILAWPKQSIQIGLSGVIDYKIYFLKPKCSPREPGGNQPCTRPLNLGFYFIFLLFGSSTKTGTVLLQPRAQGRGQGRGVAIYSLTLSYCGLGGTKNTPCHNIPGAPPLKTNQMHTLLLNIANTRIARV